ncbi:hypothetical protein I3760_11G205400 [Carya illinoinensis]|nr:hypothetical protein I3760_11G205400 [Carya illinoinensis]
MKPKIVSWNVRGLNEVNRRSQIRHLLREWNADIVCLQETKLKLINRKMVRSIWSWLYVDWVYLAAQGASSGILVLWDRRVVEKMKDFFGVYSVACSFRSMVDDFMWAFAGAYGPNIDHERRLLWDELAGLHS